MIFVMAPVMLQNIGNIMLPVACSIFSDITCTNTNSDPMSTMLIYFVPSSMMYGVSVMKHIKGLERKMPNSAKPAQLKKASL